MRKINQTITLIYRKFVGELHWAIKNGLICGENVTVMGRTTFGSEPYLITLKDHVRISENVTFINHDGGTWAFRHMKKYQNIKKFGTIIIGEYSFIGACSVIMPGVEIGQNCVIGAGSIVTKSIPDNTVVAGVPARKICSTEEYAEKCAKKMPDDFDLERLSQNKKKYLIEYYMQ
ncbi:MAG TPA: acyltransferase [Oscillospiraceae bacterium]|nr:acyltransferase [Oscillospiraceae bacterium]HPF56580.1 acyltransferase [Clostridiales bacterium]HPK36288.1 acyltransferase [Oscillospiraceae bacterium]HPR75020.1 acyltransferase [Oscillospiraceae bacterium]